MISPIQNPGAYNVFKLDSLTSPGKSTITSCNGRELQWQEQQSPGMTGAFVVFRGEKLVSVTYRIELWTDAQFQTYQTLADYLTAAKNARPPRGMRLIDLRLADMRIPSVAVAVLPYQQMTSPGLWAYEVKLQEYKKQQIFGGVPKPRNAIESAIDAQGIENKALRGEVAAAKAAARAGK